MPILEATYDPSWAAVRLVVDGGMWPSPVAQLRIERSAPGAATIPVRGAEDLWRVGGFWVGTDHEMPLNTSVQYTVFGFNEYGEPVAQESANVSTAAPGRRVWLKVAGQPDFSQRVLLRAVGNVTPTTRGGLYQVHGGRAVAQTAGRNTDSLTVTVGTLTEGAWGALYSAMAAGVILVQGEADVPSSLRAGWYFVNVEFGQPGMAGFQDGVPVWHQLTLSGTDMPAGYGVQSTGTTWGGVLAECDTWQDVIDGNSTWFDLLQGA
ncbi:hypothetical protein LQF12_02135 [Ruania suaedae]|uniref:hypothetical protein n=1 Tax=Ruania suaedae TaxID=2897774 RepID=UPI001E3B04D4|nr:hypothetical protein [Ruania suaedae]UFU03431.1 hypothetical protein LQF12_02135 [Ruania suaedae]